MRKVFLQIGYPKCFSTSLQRSFFEQHPEIAYGGVGIQDNISYTNPDIEFIFESLLKYATRNYFHRNLEKAQGVLVDFSKKNQGKKLVFSSEHLVFPFSLQHLDPYETIERIKTLFRDFEIHILLVLRRQDGLLKSLYGEYVKMGYPESFSDFIQWVWAYRDRNFYHTLDYNQTLAFLSKNLGLGNVNIQFFEKWKGDSQKQINSALSEILGIENKNLPIKNDNPSLNKEDLAILLQLNKVNHRGMGKHLLTPFENHRNRESLDRLQAGYTNDQVFKNVLDKRRALTQIGQEHNSQIATSFYRLSPQAEIAMDQMKKEWGATNKDLKEKYLPLPENYLSF